jgi:hypothetical protein
MSYPPAVHQGREAAQWKAKRIEQSDQEIKHRSCVPPMEAVYFVVGQFGVKGMGRGVKKLSRRSSEHSINILFWLYYPVQPLVMRLYSVSERFKKLP